MTRPHVSTLLIIIRKIQSARKPLQQQTVTPDLLKQRMWLRLARRPRRHQVRQRPHSPLSRSSSSAVRHAWPSISNSAGVKMYRPATAPHSLRPRAFSPVGGPNPESGIAWPAMAKLYGLKPLRRSSSAGPSWPRSCNTTNEIQETRPRQVSSPRSTLTVSVARSSTNVKCARKRCPVASLVRMSSRKQEVHAFSHLACRRLPRCAPVRQ
jgi:hypothetical protein